MDPPGILQTTAAAEEEKTAAAAAAEETKTERGDKNIEHTECSLYIRVCVTLVAGHCYDNPLVYVSDVGTLT